MTAFLVLLQFVAIGFALAVADAVSRQSLCLRWVQMQHSVMVQRRTCLGLWIPYKKHSFGDATAAQEWIGSEIARHKAEAEGRFGPETRD